jgi:hypothetical protein
MQFRRTLTEGRQRYLSAGIVSLQGDLSLPVAFAEFVPRDGNM